MAGGLIQLVTYGSEDLFLIGDPQITFFKVVYRRHTNFAIEPIPQAFKTPPNFGKMTSCYISRAGDLIGNMFLVITLPQVNQITNPNVQFAWVRRIGFAMIDTIEVVIGGQLIDKHYGEWLSIWSELTGMFSGPQTTGFLNMIGDIPELYNFTPSKNTYRLFIPFYFWFCRSSGLTLPLVSLQFSDVKINVQFKDANQCYITAPTQYIPIQSNLVNFKPYEYLEQIINGNIGDIRIGTFIRFDSNTQRLYYYQISKNKFISSSNLSNSSNMFQNFDYTIIGKTSRFRTLPKPNSQSISYPIPNLKNLKLGECFILVDYYFLDDEERIKFANSRHDYLIEQLYFTPNTIIEGTNRDITLNIYNPCKLLVWITQMQYIYDSKDYFNYTDSAQRKISLTETQYPGPVGSTIGGSISQFETILLNGNPRLSLRSYVYFNQIQAYQYLTTNNPIGQDFYSFSLFPLNTAPSGSCNMSQFDNVQLQLHLFPIVSVNNPVLSRAYALSYNVFRIVSGVAGLVFDT